jgi:hypothetical protein
LIQRAARAHIGLARDSAAARRTANPRPDVEPVDPQLTDVNIETGQDRPLAGARLELGHSDKRDPLGGQAIDQQLVFEPSARAPVKLDVRRSQESSLPVRDGHIAELRLAKDRAIDPPDPDAQAGRVFKPCDAIDDEAVPGRAVEEDDQTGEQEQQGEKQREQLIEQSLSPVPPQPDRRRLVGHPFDDDLGHQNACPSDTVTANGPSPVWRLSGMPTSTRIGPKLE